MFPISWSTIFRKKDGSLVNMEDAISGGGGGGGYTLPTATASRLGGVKIGEGVTVEEDGTISVSGGGGGGSIRVVRHQETSSHSSGSNVYIGGNALSYYGMQAGEKLVAVIPASGHFTNYIRCSTASNGAGKKFSDMVSTDTVYLYADLKYDTSTASPAEICFVFESA